MITIDNIDNRCGIRLGFINDIQKIKVDSSLEDYSNYIERVVDLVKSDEEKFNKEIIDSVYNTIRFDFTLGSDAEDEEYFEQTIKPYLYKEMKLAEYIKIADSMVDMSEILDYGKMLSNANISLNIRTDEGDDDFIIEISDDGIFSDEICIIFDYDLNVTEVWE